MLGSHYEELVDDSLHLPQTRPISCRIPTIDTMGSRTFGERLRTNENSPYLNPIESSIWGAICCFCLSLRDRVAAIMDTPVNEITNLQLASLFRRAENELKASSKKDAEGLIIIADNQEPRKLAHAVQYLIQNILLSRGLEAAPTIEALVHEQAENRDKTVTDILEIWKRAAPVNSRRFNEILYCIKRRNNQMTNKVYVEPFEDHMRMLPRRISSSSLTPV